MLQYTVNIYNLLPSAAMLHTILDVLMVSPESTRPSLSRELCIVEISILCLSVCVCVCVYVCMYASKDVCRNSGETIKFQQIFLNEEGGPTLFCFSHA